MTAPNPDRLPEKYYRRRRLAAAVVILVVVALLVWGLSALARSGGSGDHPEENVAAGGETTESVEESADPAEADEDGTSETDPAETESEEPGEAAAGDGCTLQDLQIRASSDQVTYEAGVQPTFYMTVVNPTRDDCEIDLDEDALRFEVYDLATNNRVWSDTDCFDSVQTGDEVFEAGEERFFESVWSRTASAPGQCEDRPVVPAGSYLLHTVVGDNPSEAHTFNLR